MSKYQDVASRLAESARRNLGTSFVACYVTGSTARGEERPGASDIDTLIIVRGKRVYHQWEGFPAWFWFLKGFSEEAERIAKEATAPRPPLRLGSLVTTVVGEDSLRKEADGMLYFDLQGAKLLAGKDVRKDLRRPSWKTLDGELLDGISRWRERMIVNLAALDIRKSPYRLASYSVMYALPTAGAFIALKRRRLVTSKREIPGAFMKEFPWFRSSSVLQDVLEEYLNWNSRDEDLGRLSSLWLRSLQFLLEVQCRVGADGGSTRK